MLKLLFSFSTKGVLLAIACLLVISSLLVQQTSDVHAVSINSFLAKTPKPKPGGSAYDLIALVNQLRLSYGLAPFQSNGALMAAAQAHSQYQASIGSTTHTGSGGSSVKSRALAAGFGGGADVSVIENVYGGMGATPQNAVSWWQGDGPHLNTLLSNRHTDVGAGIAESGGVVYLTLDVGSVLGGSAPPAAAPSQAVSGSSPTGSGVDAPAALTFNPVVVATTSPDGSLVHLVQPGQTLWTIAASYQVDLPDLLQLNGFTESSLIFPGDKVLIKPANIKESPAAPTTGRPTLIETLTPAAASSAAYEVEPTPGATKAEEAIKLPVQTAVLVQTAAPIPSEGSASVIWIFILVMLIGGAVIFAVGKLMADKNQSG